LKSVSWSDDIHVLDSCSTDRTVDIARAAGASIVQRRFDNWSSHQNWALANIPFRYRWVLYIDADERVTPELAVSVRKAVENPGERIAFRIQRRDFWGDRWLKHVQTSTYYLRLFRPDKMRYERLVNPVSIPDGPVGELTGYLNHFPFGKGMTHWLARHNDYSSLESQQIIRGRAVKRSVSLKRIFFSKDISERRFHQKELFYQMPGRPVLKFILLYFGKLGFLDGRAGLAYSALQSFYELMIVLKTREARTQLSTTQTNVSAPEASQDRQRTLAVNRTSND
jgi:glycosyltransferase involved in cell wall biosynthesis